MHIIVVGLNHESAPVEVREQAALTPDAVAARQQELRHLAGVEEVTILSTCNRTEVYVVSVCASGGEAAARSLLGAAAPYLYVHRDGEAVEHLFRVAAGINSAILGETQVLGQVAAAYGLAREGGVTDRVLSGLFQRAVHAGKRARTETRIGQHALSPSSAAVAVTRQKLGSLENRQVVLVGTGAMAAHAAGAMRKDRIDKLTIISHSAARAATTAADLVTKFSRIEAAGLDRLPEALRDADVVITATTSQEPVLTGSMLSADRPPLVMVDIGVPRNVDASARELPFVDYYDIDDLNQVVESNLADRRREVVPVERIVAAEVESFMEWFRSLWVQPLITDLRSRAEQIRTGELDRALRRLADLSSDEREIVVGLTQTIISKLLHEPTIRLKKHATEDRGYLFAEALRDLFDLERSR